MIITIITTASLKDCHSDYKWLQWGYHNNWHIGDSMYICFSGSVFEHYSKVTEQFKVSGSSLFPIRQTEETFFSYTLLVVRSNQTNISKQMLLFRIWILKEWNKGSGQWRHLHSTVVVNWDICAMSVEIFDCQDSGSATGIYE